MNKPVFYKSFRSRQSDNISIPETSLVQSISTKGSIILDIGFGTGESSIALSQMYPDKEICGIEAYKPGIKRLLSKNMCVEYGDAMEIIERLKENTISQIYMLFPDPWQKNKHRKRRLFNKYTFKIINAILKEEGLFHFATDNINYAFEAKEIIESVTSVNIDFSRHRGMRPITKYELKGMRKNNFIFDLIYLKN